MGIVQKLVEGVLKLGLELARKALLMSPSQIAKEVSILRTTIAIQKVVVSTE